MPMTLLPAYPMASLHLLEGPISLRDILCPPAVLINEVRSFISPCIHLTGTLGGKPCDHTVLRLPDPSIARHGPSLKDRTAYHISMLITVV